MTRSDGLVLAICGLFALGGYMLMGRPFEPDRPYRTRIAEIAAKHPEDMTRAETLARLESLTQEQPDAAEPHFFIGELLRSEGRDDEAVRAYQSALRRDDGYVPAYIALADVLTRLEDGLISVQTQALYWRAYQIDETQLRAGFLAGLSDWQAGKMQEARARWSAIASRAGPQQAGMLEAWVSAATDEE